jgi:hypothetical protein
MKGDVQYLADSILLEKLAIMEIGFSKTAGIMDELGGLGSTIKSEVSSVVGDKGIATTLEEYLATGVIMKLLGPWGYVISIAASYLGFDIGAFIGSIIEFIKGKMSSGESISLDDINSAGKSLIPSDTANVDDGLATTADMLIFLRKANSEGNIMKLAAGHFEQANKNVPFFGGNGGILGKIFGNLFYARRGQSKILTIIAGIIVWVIKSVLLGAGVVGAGKLVNHYTHKDSTPNTENSVNKESEPTQQAHFNIPAPIPNSFTSSGDGNQYHINDGSSMWIVPLLNKDVAKTLIWWTTSIYPELKGHESEFTNTSSFNNMVSLLNTQIDPSHPEYVKIPPGLHTRKEVIDRFAGEVKIDKDNK